MQTEAARGHGGGREDGDECPGAEVRRSSELGADLNGEANVGLGCAGGRDERRGGARASGSVTGRGGGCGLTIFGSGAWVTGEQQGPRALRAGQWRGCEGEGSHKVAVLIGAGRWSKWRRGAALGRSRSSEEGCRDGAVRAWGLTARMGRENCERDRASGGVQRERGEGSEGKNKSHNESRKAWKAFGAPVLGRHRYLGRRTHGGENPPGDWRWGPCPIWPLAEYYFRGPYGSGVRQAASFERRRCTYSDLCPSATS
ncbi:unnamed protein product [Triticum turgidum subsp. durum]|uniref:Uncharacterized protein n=1 Tax=Triticum turgidum subsp. durum TaxID=4567 RepID=A0A9R0UWQ1_TRITD|nr:unnamed protein product [Triticum turgidum subsp. durum]